MRRLLRYAYVPLLIGLVDGIAIALCAARASEWLAFSLLPVAVAVSFLAERAIPYDGTWNDSVGDSRRDWAHAFANETFIALSVAVIPLLAGIAAFSSAWPTSAPFVVQVLIAIVVADVGVTLVHAASHYVDFMWRFHAVHHSIKRLYGFNGLMKHPLHQAMEMTGGVLPLLLLGIPRPVATALAVCIAVQLLLQHSNVDYRVGGLRKWLSLNESHRFHHLKWAEAGDVNFGLFTLVWDRLLGTYHFEDGRRLSADDLGIASKPDYPREYLPQLAYPFGRSGGCDFEGQPVRRLLARSVAPREASGLEL